MIRHFKFIFDYSKIIIKSYSIAAIVGLSIKATNSFRIESSVIIAMVDDLLTKISLIINLNISMAKLTEINFHNSWLGKEFTRPTSSN